MIARLPGGARGQGHIDASIQKDFGTVGVREIQNPFGEIVQIPRGEIFFPDLDIFDTLRQIASDAVEERCPGRQGMAIRDVTADVRIWHALSV